MATLSSDISTAYSAGDTYLPTNSPPNNSPRDYIALLKPRVMSLVVFTGLIGLLSAPGAMTGAISPIFAATAILAIALGAGASGAFNMWYDRDIDAIMIRTQKRPIPAGKVPAGEALAFSIFVGLAALLLMQLSAGFAATGWLAFSMFFYCVIYTMGLKRRTPQNIVIGGAAGAFPPLIGWVAVTGAASVEAWILFAIIFCWTPPHFWALSLYRHDDYKNAGVPMLPVVKGDTSTRTHIVTYSLILAAVSIVPVLAGMSGWLYGLVAMLASGRFLWLANAILFDRSDAKARQLFFFSIKYLFVIFSALLVDNVLITPFAGLK